jgi:hypothetical protein
LFESERGSGHIVMATVGLVQYPHFLQFYTQRGWESDVMVHENQSPAVSSYSSSFEDFFFCPNSFRRGAGSWSHIGILDVAISGTEQFPNFIPGRPMQLDESASHGTLTSHVLEGYRLFVPDVMAFEYGMLVGIEHGSESVRNNISLVVYGAVGWYGAPEPSVTLLYQFYTADHNASAAFGYTSPYSDRLNKTGDFMQLDGLAYSYSSRTFRTNYVPLYSQFSFGIKKPGCGLLLRKTCTFEAGACGYAKAGAREFACVCQLFDTYDAGQAARVHVNGAFVGLWSSMESNPYFTFSQSEFSIPPHATADSSHVTLRFDIISPPAVAPSSRWDFIPDALNAMSPIVLAQGVTTWNEIAWEVFAV